MRIAALVLGLLGSFVVFIVGVLWTDNAQHLQEVEDMARTYQSLSKEAAASGAALPDGKDKELKLSLEAVRGKARACYPMVGAGLVALLASLFVLKFPKPAGVVMALTVLGPACLYVGSLVVSLPLGLAAVLALLAKPKPPKAAAA